MGSLLQLGLPTWSSTDSGPHPLAFFWWPSVSRVVSIGGCLLCLCPREGLSLTPTGLLIPLPIPSRPWSHIAVNFVTGLPRSDGYIVILTIIDSFFKAVHFVPLFKLPSALEMAQLLVRHVSWLHSNPVEIISDHSPVFLSGFSPMRHWGLRSACPQATTCRHTARQRGSINTWKPPFAAFVLATWPCGVDSCPG